MSKPLIAATVAMLASMALLDFLWLSTVTKLLYRPKLGALLNEQLVWPPAILFYLLYGFGLALFVLRPALADGTSPLTAALYGAAFGLVAYGAYDLTNHATMKTWSLKVTLADIAWGTAATGLSAGAAAWLVLALLPRSA